ncbi:DNA topoisomerase [Escherichia coli]
MEVVSRNGADFKPVTQAETFAAVAALEVVDYKVVNREDKPTGSKPSAPFITSTLQQAASTRLSFGVKKTMMMAQRLYEAGYITYMRTDSTNLSKEAVEALREYIGEQYGAAYLPAEPNLYGSKAGAQATTRRSVHPACWSRPNRLEGMEPDAMRLYDLIWRQFVACQMTPAQYHPPP